MSYGLQCSLFTHLMFYNTNFSKQQCLIMPPTPASSPCHYPTRLLSLLTPSHTIRVLTSQLTPKILLCNLHNIFIPSQYYLYTSPTHLASLTHPHNITFTSSQYHLHTLTSPSHPPNITSMSSHHLHILTISPAFTSPSHPHNITSILSHHLHILPISPPCPHITFTSSQYHLPSHHLHILTISPTLTSPSHPHNITCSHITESSEPFEQESVSDFQLTSEDADMLYERLSNVMLPFQDVRIIEKIGEGLPFPSTSSPSAIKHDVILPLGHATPLLPLLTCSRTLRCIWTCLQGHLLDEVTESSEGRLQKRYSCCHKDHQM